MGIPVPQEPTPFSNFWFNESLTPDFITSVGIKSITFDSKSEFQHMQIINTIPFGRTLILDGKTQSAESDEFIYHESLVHPALLLHPNPKTVYIGGGGEFATAREVLKHPSVERVVMVDIDKIVCDMCREQLPEWASGAFEDARLEVYYTDAYTWLKEYTGEPFDVIIMDISDPIEAGPGYVLYTEEFYKFTITKLNQDGVFVTQSGPGAVYNWDECFSPINNTLSTTFNVVLPYVVDIPSFGCTWAFNLAYNTNDSEKARNFIEIKSDDLNTIIKARVPNFIMKFYDGISHRGMFGVPKPIRDGIEAENRIITVNNPIFMY